MKIIHASDLHLGSRINSKFNKTISEERRNDVLTSFNNLINYAKNNNVKIILLSGDVFDSDHPTKKDKEYFYDAIRSTSEILFFYLKGNHDKASYEEYDIPNLKCFSSKFKTYDSSELGLEYCNLTISGVELYSDNIESFYTDIDLPKESTNIVMLHGEVSIYKKENTILLPKLRGKNINYLALGHIHNHNEMRLDDDGKAVYSGCLEGRGFDETDEKGFYLLDINVNTKEIVNTFIAFSKRKFVKISFDITNYQNLRDVYEDINEKILEYKNDFVRVILIGKRENDFESMVQTLTSFLKEDYYYIEVIDNSKVKLEMPYTNELSIRSEFASILSNKDYSDDEKEDILSLAYTLIEEER